MYYDRQGQPMELMDWARKHADPDYKIVAQHWVRGWMVSTVWLGLNHRFAGDGPPIIFETMIFPPGDETPEGESMMSEQYCDRYATEAAAQVGHDQAIASMRERLGDDALADIAGPLIDGSSDSQWDGDLGLDGIG